MPTTTWLVFHPCMNCSPDNTVSVSKTYNEIRSIEVFTPCYWSFLLSKGNKQSDRDGSHFESQLVCLEPAKMLPRQRDVMASVLYRVCSNSPWRRLETTEETCALLNSGGGILSARIKRKKRKTYKSFQMERKTRGWTSKWGRREPQDDSKPFHQGARWQQESWCGEISFQRTEELMLQSPRVIIRGNFLKEQAIWGRRSYCRYFTHGLATVIRWYQSLSLIHIWRCRRS